MQPSDEAGKVPDQIAVGVVGLGFMGRTHVGAFSRAEGCEVVAVADQDAGRLTGESGEGGNFETGGEERLFDPAIVSTSEEAFELIDHPEVELVSITTPTPTHLRLARAVMASGRHLLVEKPVDLDPEAIKTLAAEAREAGVLAMPAHCMRFWPAWVWMKARLDERAYGRCVRASFLRRGAVPGWNQDFYRDETKSGGAIVDLHIHDTDFILHCFGTPTAVRSQGSRQYVTTHYEYPDGPEVIAEGGWLDDPETEFRMTARFECERGTMTFDIGRDPEVVVELADGSSESHPEASEGGTGYDGQVRALLDAIDSDAAEPPVTLDDAAETARVLMAEIASLDAGGGRQAL